jgi:hypothetical protein
LPTGRNAEAAAASTAAASTANASTPAAPDGPSVLASLRGLEFDLCLNISINGLRKEVNFPFAVGRDTADKVAMEMREELSTDDSQQEIAQLIMGQL